MQRRRALIETTAVAPRWSGSFSWWHRIEDLRAFGMRWSEIERDMMARNVRWDDGP